MADKKFLSDVEEACDLALEAVGFQKLRKGRVVWSISHEFLGWVGLNRGNHGEFVRINPFVGVHAVDVMKLCASLDEARYVKGEIASYAIPIGELIPDELNFLFKIGDDLSIEATRLARVIHTGAVPYMSSIASYDSLLGLIEDRMSMLGGYPQRYAVVLHLLGRTDEAIAFVRNVMDQKTDFAAYSSDHFLKFGRNFLEVFENA